MMVFNAKPDDSGNANKIAADIAAAAASVASKEAPNEDEPDDKLDAKAELFVRKVTDSVRTAIAELLNPSTPVELPADEEEVEEEGKKVRRKRKPSAPVPKKRSLLDKLL
jgi:hypothetical protein